MLIEKNEWMLKYVASFLTLVFLEKYLHAGWPNVCVHDYCFLGYPESYCEKYRVLSQLWEGGEDK